jgi:tetratricopeptide (TPR) repeat protein
LLASACAEPADRNAARAAYEAALASAQAGGTAGLEAAARDLAVELEHDPGYVEAWLLRGAVLERSGGLEDAERAYREAARLAPAHADPPLHLARLERLRSLDQRIEAARQALPEARRQDPAAAHRALADLLLERRLAEPARFHYTRALRHDPDDAGAHSGLAVALVGVRQQVSGLYHASEALRLRPDDARALGELVWVLATSSETTLRAPDEAIRWAEASEQRTPRLLDGLAAAYAAVGRADDAIATARAAAELATQHEEHALARAITRRVALYQAGRSFIGPPVDPG